MLLVAVFFSTLCLIPASSLMQAEATDPDSARDARIEDVGRRLQELKQMYASKRDALTAAHQARVSEVEGRITELKARSRQADSGAAVAFLVTDPTERWYEQYVKVQYPNVVLNEGQGWMDSQDEFICPVAGFYLFTFGQMPQWEQQTSYALMHNDAPVAASHVLTSRWGQGAATAVIQCARGDRVWLQTYWASHAIGDGSGANHFSGALVVCTECN